MAGFLLYMAFPSLHAHSVGLAHLFWFSWLVLFTLVVGGNLAIILKINYQPERSIMAEKVPQRMKN